MTIPRIGVLALQGDFAAHVCVFATLGLQAREVRRCRRLAELDALVIPGGESTTLLNLMGDEPWFEALREFHAGGGAMFGTCAGAILLARQVLGPRQPGLGLIDAVIERNAYGRQIDSFEAHVELRGSSEPLPAAFIRAPRFRELGPDVEVLGRLGDEPVLVCEGRVMAATFHSELTGDDRVHRRFVEIALDGVRSGTARHEGRAAAAAGRAVH